jgi:hypothetical protein
MNYLKHYNLLVERGKTRILAGYCETHHILPECMGGDNSPENLVQLTPEEHFLAHLLLVKIHPDNRKLLFAARCMTAGQHRKSNKLYGWLKRRISESGHSEETKLKMSVASKGKKKSKEHAENIKRNHVGSVGMKHSIEAKAKIAAAQRKPKSPETIARMKAAQQKRNKSTTGMAGKKHSPETLERMKLAWVRRRKTAL